VNDDISKVFSADHLQPRGFYPLVGDSPDIHQSQIVQLENGKEDQSGVDVEGILRRMLDRLPPLGH